MIDLTPRPATWPAVPPTRPPGEDPEATAPIPRERVTAALPALPAYGPPVDADTAGITGPIFTGPEFVEILNRHGTDPALRDWAAKYVPSVEATNRLYWRAVQLYGTDHIDTAEPLFRRLSEMGVGQAHDFLLAIAMHRRAATAAPPPQPLPVSRPALSPALPDLPDWRPRTAELVAAALRRAAGATRRGSLRWGRVALYGARDALDRARELRRPAWLRLPALTKEIDPATVNPPSERSLLVIGMAALCGAVCVFQILVAIAVG